MMGFALSLGLGLGLGLALPAAPALGFCPGNGVLGPSEDAAVVEEVREGHLESEEVLEAIL